MLRCIQALFFAGILVVAARAFADPAAQIGFRAFTVAGFPAQTLFAHKCLHIRQFAVFVFLQDHALAARHFRYLVEREN